MLCALTAIAGATLRCELWPDGKDDHRQEIESFFAGTLDEPAAVLVAESIAGLIGGFVELSIRADVAGLEGKRAGYVEGLYVRTESRLRVVKSCGETHRTMKTFRIPIEAKDEPEIEQEVRDFVKQWVGLLAEQKFDEALAQLSSEVPPGSGSVDPRQSPQWTGSLLEAAIANFGTAEPWDGSPQTYAVVSMDDSLRAAFEGRVSVSFYPARSNWRNAIRKWLPRALMSRNAWLGAVEFDLPLNYSRGNALSDLSARLLFKPIGTAEMVLVLLDLHVL